VTDTTEPDLDEPRAHGVTVGRVLAALVVLAIAAFWIYAFSPWAPDDKADALADRALVDVVNARCRVGFDQLDALPRANQAATPAERAAILDDANAVVARTVDGLRADAAGATGRDRELLDLWLADWDAYLASRERYADELRGGDESAEFTVPARDGGQITQTMDGFSRTNDLAECLVPLDV
jgi:hypothetical protein